MTPEFQGEIRERLSKIETLLYSLVGNGQPGRITVVERNVEELRLAAAATKGGDRITNIIIAAAISAGIHWFPWWGKH